MTNKKTEQLFPYCGNPTFCGWKTGPKKDQCFYAGRCQWKNKTHWLQSSHAQAITEAK